jgi:hypothetical protein
VKVCTACATETDEAGRFCPECGAALVDSGRRGAGRSALARATTAPSDPRAAARARASTNSDQRAVRDSCSSASKLIGLTIDGQFEIEGILGGGSFGTVYRGRQIGLDRPVAIKVPTSEIAADPFPPSIDSSFEIPIEVQ